MKVATLLLLAYLSCFASAQLSFNVDASCSTAAGCSLSSIINNIGTTGIAALTSGNTNLDFSAVGTGLNINIDAGLLTYLTGLLKLNLASIAVAGKNTVTVASGVVLTTANLTVAQSSNAVISGTVTVQSSASASATFVVDASSTIFVTAGGAVNSAAAVVVAGSANVQGTITSASQYTQSQGSLVLNSTASANGTVSAPTISIAGSAFLSGNGVVGAASSTASATVYVDGTVSVGNSPGAVTVNGDWRPSGTATFKMEIASSTSYDKLYVTGKAYVKGFLRVYLLNNYVPDINQHFPFIFAAGGTDGSFTATTADPISVATKFSSSVTANQVIANYSSAVTVVVSSLVMLACVLASLL